MTTCKTTTCDHQAALDGVYCNPCLRVMFGYFLGIPEEFALQLYDHSGTVDIALINDDGVSVARCSLNLDPDALDTPITPPGDDNG